MMEQPGSHQVFNASDDWQAPFLLRIADELRGLEVSLAKLQDGLSEVLDRTTVSPETMKRIQTLDETTQILRDLARAVQVIGEHHGTERESSEAEVCDYIILRELRLRLCGKAATSMAAKEMLDGEVNLF